MSGIMTATVGTVTASGIIYGAGLYSNVSGVDLSPIDGSIFISSGSTSVDETWIGYFTPASTGSTSLSLQTTAFDNDFNDSASTTGRLWLGPTAVSGFTDGNANIAAFDNDTATTAFSLLAGVKYPVRIRWTGSYSVGGFSGSASGSITFLVAGSSNVSNRIFYNTLTNGF
jgi:hypothetical protein